MEDNGFKAYELLTPKGMKYGEKISRSVVRMRRKGYTEDVDVNYIIHQLTADNQQETEPARVYSAVG